MAAGLKNHLNVPRLAQTSLDLLVCALAWYLAYVLRFDGHIPATYFRQLLMLWPVVVLLRLVCRFPFGLHQHLWRFVSLRETLEVGRAVTLGSVGLLVVSRLVYNAHVPWGILGLDWGFALFGLLALRGVRRSHAERLPASADRRRVLMVGAGQAGNMVVRELLVNARLMPVGFVDDDAHKQGGRVQGIPVLGGTADIPALVAGHQVDEIVLCVPSIQRQDLRRILDRCQEARVPVKTIPGLQDLLSGKVAINAIREIQIEDLLNRDPVSLDRDQASGYVAGRVVMVTGAGGSIGSELCRQLAELGPKRLVLLGRGEFGIYTTEMELRERFPDLAVEPIVGDVRDRERLARIFAAQAPQVVFHAAAHKHVPLMERNPGEAVLNNVFGTRNVAELAHEHGAEAFVLVSTDKAVNPTNVMGATKRAAELVVQELASRSSTRFMSVRFGNVLGSRGSVVPLFKRQIAQGGPITITHPEVIRYFMTIPEATQLVIQAGALGKGGEVFVLDMGEPVKIVDLARDLIKLSGLEPDVDIKLHFTGLRPGEKLYEELLTAEEGTTATTFKKIFTARSTAPNPTWLAAHLAALRTAADGDGHQVRAALAALVATYHPAPLATENAR